MSSVWGNHKVLGTTMKFVGNYKNVLETQFFYIAISPAFSMARDMRVYIIKINN